MRGHIGESMATLQAICKVLWTAYCNVAMQVFYKLNMRSHRRVHGNIARESFCKLYAKLFGEHLAALPGKCFASLMQGRSGEYMATLPGNLFATFKQRSRESMLQHYQASVSQA